MIQSAGSMNPTKFTARNKEYITYSQDSVVYFYGCFDGTLDSLVLMKKNLSSLHQKIYEPLPNPYQQYLFGLLGIGLIAAGGFYLYKKKGKAVPSATQPLHETNNHLEIFTALELELIHKIIENGDKNGRTTKVEEVNHLLGVANKTIDMQKRKRSNTIRSINEKYGIVIKKLDYQLIKREKNESDGRSNEFYINSEDAIYFKS
jgi:LPXTG-motif cell wall-anchored protein